MGKTRFTKELIKKKLDKYPWYNIYHLDTKKQGDYDERDGTVIRNATAPPAFKSYGNRMVWQPAEDDKLQYSHFFQSILDAGLPSIVNVDETKNLVFGKLDNIPRGFGLILYQGRLPGINVYGGTQEVYQSPRAMYSQASDVICFDVDNSYDEMMMLNYLRLPKEVKHLGLKKYEFYHRDKDGGSPARLFKSYQDFLMLVK
jgi:hypothetical protein